MDTSNLTIGAAGVGLSAVGTALQVNEILQTISLVLTILGAVVSFIVLPLLNWWKEAKKDGKIDADEIKDAAETLKDGIYKTKDAADKEKGEK